MDTHQTTQFFAFLTEYLKSLSPIASVLAIGFGAMFIKRPVRAIEFQMKFYRAINWKMEPVSWEREVRNTRTMGAVAVLCGLIGLIAIVVLK